MDSAQQDAGFNYLSPQEAAKWSTLFCLLAGTICILVWLRRFVRPKPSRPASRGVRLEHVTPDRTEADTDLDIIAIHGLDTTSRYTWTWKDPRDPKNKSKWVNWLRPGMLPANVHRVRIFTCDWPADLLVSSNLIQKTIEEYSLLLLEGIESTLFAGNKRPRDRPIMFIASCLGGVILIRALVHANDRTNRYYRLRTSTRAVVFLATPFRGTSFQDVATWAQVGLAAKASLRGRKVTKLLDSVKRSNIQLEDMVSKFTRLCQDMNNPCEVFSFYELGITSLPHKAFPWLPAFFGQKKQLVDRSSATLDIMSDPLPLDRPHSLMNKFQNSQCRDYEKVANRIRAMVWTALGGTALQQADRLIREQHYTPDRLKIKRLSGDELAMDQCYINLTLVEKYKQNTSDSENRDTTPSPFSILARQKVDLPDQTTMVELEAIFDERKAGELPLHPRRILIRGRAGVGKTTLCKKIVYEFTKGTLGKWNDLFDRVLWVPLRNLKLSERRNMPKYTFEDLFRHEFLLPTNEQDLVGALFRELHANKSKTLFLLDGLDEVSQDLTGDGSMPRFLAELLRQPNIIITSRPSARPPANLDLELETIGFSSHQVDEYIRRCFTDPISAAVDQTKVDKIQAFLQHRWLIQGLVRIPIQLDALCYTWDDLKEDAILNTMTGIYEEIELRLWKKDVLRLSKKHDDNEVTTEHIQMANRRRIEGFVMEEMTFVESLAFTGLCNDMINFTPQCLESISEHFALSLLPGKTLPSLSFLRASDDVAKHRNRDYHFIHLTFQEYFAARYFTRQWNSRQGKLQILILSNNAVEMEAIQPAKFLQRHKYTARYDVFWRFVAGLLDVCGRAPEFIDAIEEAPLDLLGPAHQRLVMHCLSEISGDLATREFLERRLARWLLFEYEFKGTTQLSSEVEFPESALTVALSEKSSPATKSILQSLGKRASIPQSVISQTLGWLNGVDCEMRETVLGTLAGPMSLPEEVLMAIVARLGDENSNVRYAALVALCGRAATMPTKVLLALVLQLDNREYVGADIIYRPEIVSILGEKVDVPDEVVTALLARVNDESGNVGVRAVSALRKHILRSSRVLQAIVPCLGFGEDRALAGSQAFAALEVCLPVSDEVPRAILAYMDSTDEVPSAYASKLLVRSAATSGEMLRAVISLLNSEDKLLRVRIISAAGESTSVSDELLQAIVAQLDRDKLGGHFFLIPDAVKAHKTLSNEVFAAIRIHFDNTDWQIRQVAMDMLVGRRELPTELFIAVLEHLGDKDCRVRRSALDVLATCTVLSDEVLGAVATCLEDDDFDVRTGAFLVLSSHTVVPDKVLEVMATNLNHKQEIYRLTALTALRTCTVVPDQVLRAVAVRLDDKSWKVRKAVIRTLTGYAAVPDATLRAIATRLDDESSEVKWQAFTSLSRHSTVPDDILMAIVVRLERVETHLQYAVIENLDQRAAIPDEILRALAVRLDAMNTKIRCQLILALGRRMAIADEVFRAIVARLEDDNSSVREAAIEALSERAVVPEKVLMFIVARLYDEEDSVQQCAIKVLRECTVSDEVLRAMAACLGSIHVAMRVDIVAALGTRAVLPDDVLRTIVEQLEYEDDVEVPKAAMEALGNRAALPDYALVTITRLLDSPDYALRRAALDILMPMQQVFDFSRLDECLCAALYNVLLEQSFDKQVSWYIRDGRSYISYGEISFTVQLRDVEEWLTPWRWLNHPPQ